MYPWLNYKIFSGPKTNIAEFLSRHGFLKLVTSDGSLLKPEQSLEAAGTLVRSGFCVGVFCFFLRGKKYINPQLKLFKQFPRWKGKNHCWNPLFFKIHVCNDKGLGKASGVNFESDGFFPPNFQDGNLTVPPYAPPPPGNKALLRPR